MASSPLQLSSDRRILWPQCNDPSVAAYADRSGRLPTDGCCQRDPQHHRLNYNLEEWMEDQKLMDNDPLLALVAKDNNAETLKEGVKAQEKIETEE